MLNMRVTRRFHQFVTHAYEEKMKQIIEALRVNMNSIKPQNGFLWEQVERDLWALEQSPMGLWAHNYGIDELPGYGFDNEIDFRDFWERVNVVWRGCVYTTTFRHRNQFALTFVMADPTPETDFDQPQIFIWNGKVARALTADELQKCLAVLDPATSSNPVE